MAGQITDQQALLPRDKLVESLQLLIAPGDRFVVEGDNQKQADFLSRCLVRAGPKTLHDLHLIISGISRQAHLTLFRHQPYRRHRGPRGSARVAQRLLSRAT